MASDSEMTAAVPPITEPPTRSAAAERMRLHRERRRKGLRCLMIELRETEIDALIRQGLLKSETRNDPNAVNKALLCASRTHLGLNHVTRNRRAPRLTVERLAEDSLDVHELQRAGIFRDGWVTLRPSLRWPRIEQMRAARYLIELKLRNQVVPQRIRVSWTRCHFGGFRPWLHCLCGRRVAKLLKGFGGYYCRACVGNPIYASQGKSTQGRRHFEACKIRLRLGGEASLLAPFPERPRGMHRRTYMRLRRRGEALESTLSARLRAKPPDYPNLIHYLPLSRYK